MHAGSGLEKWEEEIQGFYDSLDSLPAAEDIVEDDLLNGVVMRAWSHYLDLEIQDCLTRSNRSFATLGGDSVALVIMCSEIQKELSMEGNQQVMSKIFARGTSITIHEMIKIYKQ